MVWYAHTHIMQSYGTGESDTQAKVLTLKVFFPPRLPLLFNHSPFPPPHSFLPPTGRVQVHTDVSLSALLLSDPPSSSNGDLLTSHPSPPQLHICTLAINRAIRSRYKPHQKQRSGIEIRICKEPWMYTFFAFFFFTVCQMFLQMLFCRIAVVFLHIQ